MQNNFTIKVLPEKEFLVLHVAHAAEHHMAIQQVMDAIHRTNEAIRCAVDAGIAVELVRTSRYHDAGGSWGDQMAPAIRVNLQ